MTEASAAPAAPAAPRPSRFLLLSLGVSALSALAWSRFEIVGPFVAGILAFLGYRDVRLSRGALRGPGLARAAMSAALVLLVLQGWTWVGTAHRRVAMRTVRETKEAVEANLRSGTPEGAWELLRPGARARADRGAFVEGLRESLRPLGRLRTFTMMRFDGGDWERFPALDGAEGADLLLPLSFDAEFERGTGRVEIGVRCRRLEGGREGGLETLRVFPDQNSKMKSAK